MRRRLTIFDLDGTLIEGHVDRPDPDGPFVQRLDFLDVRPLPGRAAEIAQLLDNGGEVAIATNKAGVGFGHHTVEDCRRKEELVRDALGFRGRGVSWHECYYHPDARFETYRRDSFFRKPRPGMLVAAMLAHCAGPRETLMVGDMEADRGAAEAAGCNFAWAQDYFAGDDRMEAVGG